MARLLLLALAFAAEAESPVEKVARLLKDMQSRLSAEAKEDSELYDQLSCWCATNKKEKTEAVEIAEKAITTLTSDIEEFTAKSAELKTTIERLSKEISEDQDALDKATAIREKEHREFSSSEKDLMESLSAVSSAVDTLGKQSFLQAAVALPLKRLVSVLTKHEAVLPPSRRHLLASFLSQPAGSSYDSQSDAILGILKQMKETFTTNLSAEQKEEQNAQQEYAALKAAKTREIKAASGQRVDKSKLLANTNEDLAHAKHDLEATRNALTADQKFIVDLTARCNAGDKEFSERSQLRATEIAAVSEALSILSGDEARDTFSAALGFTQKKSDARTRAAAVLRRAAKGSNSALTLLANKVSLDAFTKVLAAIDEMVGDLKTQQKEEVVHQRFCTKELRENEAGQAAKKAKIEDLTVEMDDNTGTVETVTKEIEVLQAQVAEMKVQVKRASEDREAANKEFQQTIADQRATQEVLQKVYNRLATVYAPKKAFVQAEPGAAVPPPPPAFKAYKKDGGAGGVLGLIQEIVNEAISLEKETLHAEQSAQSDYEAFVKDSAEAIGADDRSIAGKLRAKAALETSLVTDASDKKATIADLEMLGSYEKQLHLSCDYVLANFDARQDARDQEMDALGNAKAILSGADFD
jgi:chromosome segregation ATPase